MTFGDPEMGIQRQKIKKQFHQLQLMHHRKICCSFRMCNVEKYVTISLGTDILVTKRLPPREVAVSDRIAHITYARYRLTTLQQTGGEGGE